MLKLNEAHHEAMRALTSPPGEWTLTELIGAFSQMGSPKDYIEALAETYIKPVRQVPNEIGFSFPNDSVTACEAEGCDNDSCSRCNTEIDPDDHAVVWWGPVGWSICNDCAINYIR